MPSIAIIDDRIDLRTTLKNRVEIELQKEWNSIDTSPLPQLSDYYSWITENEISVLLLDERLNEKIDRNSKSVDYCGHDLVDYVRKYFVTLPIYIVTSYPDDDSLKAKFKDVEDIIPRREFCQKASDYMPRIIRSGQKFLETFENELVLLSKKAKKIVLGKATAQDIKAVKAVQTKLAIAYPSDVFIKHTKILKKIATNLKKLNKLKIKISKQL